MDSEFSRIRFRLRRIFDYLASILQLFFYPSKKSEVFKITHRKKSLYVKFEIVINEH